MSALPHKSLSHVSLIQLDAVVLAVPQSNLHTVESVLDIKPAHDARVAGYIELHGEVWPVYSPTDKLVPVAEMTDDHRICAMLISGDSLFGLMCREVINADAAQLKAFKLPECMRTPDTPLYGVGLLGKRVVCLTSAPSLHALFTAEYSRDDAGVTGTQSRRGDRGPVTDTTEASA